ncbi:hypothetical protein M5689_009737 [Euphorbia peplus]|nr:hypothetical protein M5689_009737 [Euphorbia peplus]
MESLEDLKNKIKKHTTPQQDRHWFKDVERLQGRVISKKKEAQDEIRQICCRWFCPAQCCFFEGLDGEVNDVSNELKDLISKGECIEKELMGMRSLDKRPILGLPSLVDQIEDYIGKSSVQTIGIYNSQHSWTNLLVEINKKLSRNFLVISVKVEGLENEAEIQEAIIRKLKIWENQSEDERSSVIRDFLGTKKFVLLLDRLTERWEHSNLSRIGILNLEESKIIITARTESIFKKMGVDVCVQAELFTPDDAIALFKSFANLQLLLDLARLAAFSKVYAFPLSRSFSEPQPLDLARLAMLAEGPIAVGIIVVSWVFLEDQEHAMNGSNTNWPNGKLVDLMDAQKYLKHFPY